MKKILSKYVFEILILLIGLALGLAQNFFVHDVNLAILITSTSTLLSLTTLAIRKELGEQISEQFELLRIVRSISNEHWRSEAEEELDKFKFELERWARGSRVIPLNQSIPFQIKLLRRCTKRICAIHVGIPIDSLYQWDKQNGPFNRLIETHKKLGSNINKRRMFVCDDQLLKDNLVQNDRIKAIFKRQMSTAQKDGLGVELRILWQSTLLRTKNKTPPPDLLIVDDCEVVLFKGTRGDYVDDYIDMEAIINTIQVRSYINLFEFYWEIAEPAERYLD